MTTEPQLRHHPDAPEVIVAPSIPAAAGHAVAVPVEIRHRGPRAARVRVTVFGLDARWIPEPLDLGILQPGEHASIQVTVIPERGAMGAHYPFTIAAEATATGARPVVGVAESVLALGAAERISMTITPPLPAGVFSRGIRVDITNPSDETRDLTLLSDSASGISVRLRDRKVSVPGRRTVSVKGRVRVRKPTITGGHNTHTFTVAAQGTGAPEQAEATMRSKPLVGGGLRRAIALGLVIAMWIGLAIVFIPKISDRFKQKNDVASVTQTEGSDSGAGAGAGGSGSGAEGSDGAGAGGAGADGSGGAGGADGSGDGADGSAAAGGYQLSGTVTGPAADGSLVTLAPVALAGIDDGSLPETQSTDQSPRAFRSSASDAIGKSVGPLAAAPRDGFRTTTITTGEKGEFTFSGVTAPGYYLLTIAKEGFTSQRFLINSEALVAPQPLKVELVPGEGSLSGRVIGPDGSAIGAATIVVTDGTVTLQTSSVSASTQTGIPGTWSLDQVSTPGTYLVTASSPGLGSASTLVTLDASGKGTADLTLTAGLSSISGKVSGEDGLGQVGGLGGITVTATGGDITRTATTVTAAAMRGAFVLPNLPAPGTYTLTFSGQGYLTQTREVTLGASAVTVNTTVSRADAVLSGMISGRDENGKAEGGLGGVGLTLASNELTMKTMTTSGDGAGSFQFVGVPPGTYVLTATQFGRTSASTTVELAAADAQKVNLLLVADLGAELPANAHIRGQVTDSRTGGPLTCDRSVTAVAAADCVATVTVSAPKDPTQPKAGTVSYTSKATAALNFVYTIPSLDDPDNAGLPPGLYTVRISAPGYEDAITHVQVAQGQTAPAPPASMPALGIISGTVTTRVDKPAKASCVLAVPVGVTVPKNLPTSCAVAAGGNTCTASGISGAQPCALTSQGGANEPPLGTYQIRGLKHGQYQMVLISQDPEYVYTVGTVPIVTLELGADGQFNAVLDRLGRINVSVVKVDPATGSPVPVKGASVSATKQSGDGVTSAGPVTSNDNGIAILTGLDGTYKVSGSFTESGETITADATADPTGLNQTANVTLVIAKQSGPLVGRVVVDSGDGTAPVGGVTVTVSGTVGYQGSNAATGSAQVTTTTNGCYAIVPAGWNGSISTLTGPNCTFTANDQAAVGTLKNLLTGQPATLISDRIDVSVAALPKGTAGDTWTETYPATGQAIADCIAGGCSTGARMIPDINVKASAMDVGSLTLYLSGPSGFLAPSISSLHFTVLSKPANAGGVTLDRNGNWGSITTAPASMPDAGYLNYLKFTDSQYGATSGKALPGRYKFQVTLTDFVTQSIDLVCQFKATTCFFTSADGDTPNTEPQSFTLDRLPAISVNIIGLTNPSVTSWASATASQTGGASLGTIKVIGNDDAQIDLGDGTSQTVSSGYLTFNDVRNPVVPANTTYSFAVTIPGYGTSPLPVTCGANYLAGDCTYSGSLTALPTFPSTTVQLKPATEPVGGAGIALGQAITGTVTSPPNLASTILVTVDDNGMVSWKDSRGGVNPGQVMPGDYEITFRRAGFVDTTATLSCNETCEILDVVYDDPEYTITLPMLPQPQVTVTVKLPSEVDATDDNGDAILVDVSHSSFKVYRVVGGTATLVSSARLSMDKAKVVAAAGSTKGDTATADVTWNDTTQPFPGITPLGTYRVDVSVDGYQDKSIPSLACTTAGAQCPGDVTLETNPASAKAITKFPDTTTKASLVVAGGPAGAPSVSLVDDGNGNLIWKQGNSPVGVVTPGGTYQITATLSGYESSYVDSSTDKTIAANPIQFQCPTAENCAFPQIVMTKTTALKIELVDQADQPAGTADMTLYRDGQKDGDYAYPGGATITGRSTSQADATTGWDGSYTLDVKAAGFTFREGTTTLGADSPNVECKNGSTTATAGLKLIPGGTTTCTVTLQRLGSISGTTSWQIKSLTGGNGDVPAIGSIALKAILLETDGSESQTSFTTTSASDGTFTITGGQGDGEEGLAAGNWKIETTNTSGRFADFAGVVTVENDDGMYRLAAISPTISGLTPIPVDSISRTIAIVLTPIKVNLDIQFMDDDDIQMAPEPATIKVTDAQNNDWVCVINANGAVTDGSTPIDLADPESERVCSIDANKTVQFIPLSPGTYTVAVGYDNPGYSDVTSDRTVEPSGVSTVLQFTPGAQVSKITGALADVNGTPITTSTGATIELWNWTCSDQTSAACTAEDINHEKLRIDPNDTATGLFEFEKIIDGKYQVVVTAPGYAQGRSEMLDLKAGNPPLNVTVKLRGLSATSVKFKLNLGDGTDNAELNGATVVLIPAENANDDAGGTLSGYTASSDGTVTNAAPVAVPVGNYHVIVTLNSDTIPYPLETSTVLQIKDTDDGKNVDLSASPLTLSAAKVTATADWTSADLGCVPAPTSAIPLQVKIGSNGDWVSIGSTAIPIDGTDSASGTVYLPVGTYYFQAILTAWKLKDDVKVVIAETDTTGSASILVVPETTTFALKVTTDGANSSSVEATATASCTPSGGTAYTKDAPLSGTSGSITVPGGNSGWTFKLAGTVDGEDVTDIDGTLSGTTVTFNVVPTPTATPASATITVKDGDNAATGATVEITSEDGTVSNCSSATETTGEYTCTGLEASASYTVKAMWADSETSYVGYTSVAINAEGTGSANISLTESVGLTVTVVDNEDSPIEGATVTLTFDSITFSATTATSTGAASFSDLPKGIQVNASVTDAAGFEDSDINSITLSDSNSDDNNPTIILTSS